MKISSEVRKTILAACKSDADSWTNGNAPEIILDALDELSEEAKLELCLRYLPSDHLIFKSYGLQKLGQMMEDAERLASKPPKPRDYTPSSEGRGT